MNILVCVSIVPDTTYNLNITEDNNIDYSNINFIINPFDEFCLSKIIKLKENNDLNISILNVGDAKNDPILRKCFAIGADEVTRINSDTEDSFTVAKNISDYISKHNFDIILFGKESIDFNGSCVYGIVSGITKINMITNVIDIKIDKDITIKNEVNGNITEYNVKKNIIISTKKEIIKEDEIIIPNVRKIMESRQKEIKIIDFENNNERISKIEKIEKIDAVKECRIIEADDFINILKENNLYKI